MKRCVLALCLLLTIPAFGQQSSVPEIPFRSVPDFLKLPTDMYLGEVSGVAVNSKGHVFVFYARQHEWPRLCGGGCELLEFDPNGKFLREIGHNLYAWSFAHDGEGRQSRTTSGSPIKART